MKKKWIVDEFLEEGFWLIWDCSPKEATDFVNTRFSNNPFEESRGDANGRAFTFETSKTTWATIALFIKNKKEALNDFVLDHELVHVVMHGFNNRGVPISLDNTETFAYYLTYLKRKIMAELKKK